MTEFGSFTKCIGLSTRVPRHCRVPHNVSVVKFTNVIQKKKQLQIEVYSCGFYEFFATEKLFHFSVSKKSARTNSWHSPAVASSLQRLRTTILYYV